MTSAEQNRIGESLYLDLKESGQINSDPIVNNYVSDLGQRLLTAMPTSPQSFTFFVIDNPQINAFAMFGGYIGIYSGLIRAAKNESEVASVIAHEIAHITQDHLRRTLEKSSKMGVPVTAAILAAILLGESAPELAEATVTAVIAGQQQQQLSFSRNHEQEADRLGIERLASANFNPEAMAQFFALIKERSRYSAAYPEYLQTHPVSNERISEAQNRARQLPQTEDKSSTEFSAIQARLTLSESKDIEHLIRSSIGKSDVKSRYTLSLALLEDRRYKESIDVIRQLLNKFPNILPFQITEAEIHLAMNNRKLAESSYNAILNISPYNRLVIIRLAELHLLNNENKRSEVLLHKLAEYIPLNAIELRLLAKIAAAQGDKAKTHLNMGNAFALEKKYQQSLSEFLKAQKFSTGSFYLNNRIEARIEEIEEILANRPK